jgi:hypothetical protein
MKNQPNYSEALNQLVDAQLLSLFTLGSGAEAQLRKLIENNLKRYPDDYLISVSAEFDLLKQHTSSGYPDMPGMYLKLLHGRTFVGQKLNNWGEEGPWIGPLEWFHCTNLSDIGIGFVSGEELSPMQFDDDYPSPMYLYQSFIYYDGVYYADWELQRC